MAEGDMVGLDYTIFLHTVLTQLGVMEIGLTCPTFSSVSHDTYHTYV